MTHFLPTHRGVAGLFQVLVDQNFAAALCGQIVSRNRPAELRLLPLSTRVSG